jgi:hypothetical protein
VVRGVGKCEREANREYARACGAHAAAAAAAFPIRFLGFRP